MSGVVLSGSEFRDDCRPRFRYGALGLLVLSFMALSGCNEHSIKPLEQARDSSAGEHATLTALRVREREPRTNSEALKQAFKANGQFFRTASEIRAEPSAVCRRILAQAGISSTVLRSPTVSASVDDEASAKVSVGYDVLDWKRANLIEEASFARCERTEIINKLTQLTVTSNQSLSRSGYLAQAKSLSRSRGQFSNIRRAVTSGLAEGFMTVGSATRLRQYISQIISREASARGEAARRQVVDELRRTDFRALDTRLMRIERRIHDIDNRRRSVDAFKVQTSASYGGDVDDAFGSSNDSGTSASAKVEVSVRLGALYNRRHELEEISREARQSLHHEKGSGVLWRTNVVRDSIRNVLRSLHQRRRDLTAALRQAQRNAAIASDDAFAEELLSSRLRARVDILALKSELAGINATIRDTQKVVAQLSFKR